MPPSTNATSPRDPVPQLRLDFCKKFAYALVLSVSLHGLVWQLRDLFAPPIPAVRKPPTTIEVVMESKPRLLETTPVPPPVAPPAPPVAPPVPPLPPKPPKPQPPVSLPKPKPQPVVQPRKMAPVPKVPTAQLPVAPVTTQAAPVIPAAPPSPPVPSAPPAPSAQPKESREETYTEAKADAAYLNNPRPDYPSQAKRRFMEGKVILKVQVLASGHPGQVMIENGSGHDILDEAALETVRQWRFVPAKRGDKAVDSWVKVPIVFKLNK